jgi:hypothetical protein
MHPIRRAVGLVLGAALLLAAAGPASAAAAPEVSTWENQVDVPYFDCGTFQAHGVWTVSHVLTVWFDADGAPLRDREKVEFTGSFVNPDTGASIADAGQIIYFDTLDADWNYVTTMRNDVRKSAYLHAAGRTDFQTGVRHGMDRFDVNVPAACAALGA